MLTASGASTRTGQPHRELADGRQQSTPRLAPGGIIFTSLIGIVGALLGGFIGRALNFYGPDEPAGFLMAFLGAVVLLAGYRMVAGQRTP